MAYQGKAITWNDVPDYDEWGVDNYWSCDNWMEWFYALEKHFGKEQARKIWNYGYSRSSFGAHHLICRETNAEFIKFIRDNGLDDNATWLSDVSQTVTLALDDVWTIIGDIFGSVKGATGGVKNLASTLRVVIPVAAIGLLALYGYRVYKSTQK